jgi:hypothetical protein
MGASRVNLPMCETHATGRADGATLCTEWFAPRPGRDVSLAFIAGATGEKVQAAAVLLKSSPDFSIACMMTASLRATAMAARLKPSFSLSLSPMSAGRSPLGSASEGL